MTDQHKTTADSTDNNDTAHGRVRDGLDDARSRASAAYDSARDKAAEAVDASRTRAKDAAHTAAQAAEANPLGIVAGSIALGALVGALLPRSEREKELLAPAGRRLNTTAAAALAAAKQAGFDELDSRGLTKDAAKEQAKSLLKGLGKAATNAGKAAADAGRDEARR